MIDKTANNNLWLVCIFSFMVILVIYIYEYGYKKGQIDALTGTIKYELKTNKDQSRSWKIIQKNS